MFNRNDYYSQTEACKKFKITVKEFQKIVEDYNLDVIEKPMQLHTEVEGLLFTVNSKYILKIDFIRGLAFFKKWVTLEI